MTNLMNRQKQILIRSRANYIRGEEERPGEEGGGAEEVGGEDLEGDNEEDEVFGQGFGTAEFCYL